ncbi:hypothetical protein Y032_0080g1331 [Ancylostoma ceylanicum]|uniref:Uncharacterized protein n=1 Tax=Ancylostoma ceylanicum TaxID=53326 RepID=A0A016TSU9_9BILA|nr:hypothetical protein Y032_0080g1331 [Ancylostoma ceylanicum]
MLDETVNIPETDPSLLDGFFLVQGVMLMQLFMVCQQCCARLSPHRVGLTAVGTTPVVHYYCPRCSLRKGGTRRWEGQRRAVEHPHEKAFLGNILAVISAVTTGTRFIVGLQRRIYIRIYQISNLFMSGTETVGNPAASRLYFGFRLLEVVQVV